MSCRRDSVSARADSRMSSRSTAKHRLPSYSPIVTVVAPIGNTNSQPARPGTQGRGVNGSILNLDWIIATRFVVSGSCFVADFAASGRENSMRYGRRSFGVTHTSGFVPNGFVGFGPYTANATPRAATESPAVPSNAVPHFTGAPDANGSPNLMPAKLSRGFASLFFRASSICAHTAFRCASSSRRISASDFFGGSGISNFGSSSTTFSAASVSGFSSGFTRLFSSFRALISLFLARISSCSLSFFSRYFTNAFQPKKPTMHRMITTRTAGSADPFRDIE